ncbi:MAG TPA: type II secretion system F family protein [Longimicrobiales bacterium]|nr:type II secretion system F family protein [Longimicrobiales bacterium]
MSAWTPAILAFIAVAFGIVALALLLEGVRATLRRRDLQSRLAQTLTELQEQTLVERELLDSSQATLRRAEQLAERVPLIGGASILLAQSGVSWSPGTFILLTFGMAIAGGVLSMGLAMPLPIAIIAALVFGALPYFYVRRRRNLILKRFEELLPEAIDYLARAIRAGHPLTAGIQMVGDELDDPLGAEFRRIFDQQRFGVPFEEALLGMCDRVELVDVRIFATSIIVQREVGGASFGEVLDNMADTIRARFAIRREINVYTAQGRLSGMVVGAMPFAVGLGIYVQDADYVRILFDHPIGRFMAVTAVVLQVIGFFWIRKVVRVEI